MSSTKENQSASQTPNRAQAHPGQGTLIPTATSVKVSFFFFFFPLSPFLLHSIGLAKAKATQVWLHVRPEPRRTGPPSTAIPAPAAEQRQLPAVTRGPPAARRPLGPARRYLSRGRAGPEQAGGPRGAMAASNSAGPEQVAAASEGPGGRRARGARPSVEKEPAPRPPEVGLGRAGRHPRGHGRAGRGGAGREEGGQRAAGGGGALREIPEPAAQPRPRPAGRAGKPLPATPPPPPPPPARPRRRERRVRVVRAALRAARQPSPQRGSPIAPYSAVSAQPDTDPSHRGNKADRMLFTRAETKLNPHAAQPAVPCTLGSCSLRCRAQPDTEDAVFGTFSSSP